MSIAKSVEMVSYEEHVKECRKYKNGREYNEAKKKQGFYSIHSDIQKRYPKKKLFEDAGWNNPLYKHSYVEHVEKCKKYPSVTAYNNRVGKPDGFYATVRVINLRFPEKNISEDAGWGRRASYEDHVKECKKYKTGEDYKNGV